jgi:hypothetical protein
MLDGNPRRPATDVSHLATAGCSPRRRDPDGQPEIVAKVGDWRFDDDDGLLDRIRASVDPDVPRPLDRALRAVGPVAVELARRRLGGPEPRR